MYSILEIISQAFFHGLPTKVGQGPANHNLCQAYLDLGSSGRTRNQGGRYLGYLLLSGYLGYLHLRELLFIICLPLDGPGRTDPLVTAEETRGEAKIVGWIIKTIEEIGLLR